MEKYHIQDNKVMWEGKVCLQPDDIGVDSTDPGLTYLVNPPFVRSVFPGRPDLLFAAGDKVVWVECKNYDDLVTSVTSKRLAREVRTGMEMADIVIVALLRPILPDIEMGLELVRLQTLGVYILTHTPAYSGFWTQLREILANPTNQRRAIAGTDWRKPRTVLAGFPGVGPVTEAELLGFYGSATNAINCYSDWAQVVGDMKAARIWNAVAAQGPG